MKFYTFYTRNLSSQLIEDHQKVCNQIGIDVHYYAEDAVDDYNQIYSSHGRFMTSVMKKEKVACFLDIDCLPHNLNLIQKSYDWVVKNQSFVGNAQNISHTQMRNHIYAAASFLIVSQNAWNTLGCPDFSWFTQNETQIDTAQLLTLRADQIGMPYQLMYPIGYDGPETFQLSGYGNYGTGTLYPATWHYFRISKFINQVPDLWTSRVNTILQNQKIIPHYSSCFYV